MSNPNKNWNKIDIFAFSEIGMGLTFDFDKNHWHPWGHEEDNGM